MSAVPERAPDGERLPWTSRVVDAFLGSNFSLLLILALVGLGAVALVATPREEDPQIVVPFVDVFLTAPGASALETQRLAAEPLERLMAEIPGVEHVYSTTQPGAAMVTVRFEVGEDRERALVDVHNKIQSNLDRVPPQVTDWLVKPVEIDDVPILAITLFRDGADGSGLRRYAEELAARLQAEVADAGRVSVHGGEPRAVRVLLDPERLRARGVAWEEVAAALRGADAAARAGRLEAPGGARELEVGAGLRDADEVAAVAVAAGGGRTLRVGELGDVVDGPGEPETYTELLFGPAARSGRGDAPVPEAWLDGGFRPAVTVALAKRQGANAVGVAADALRRFESLAREILPADVHWRVTRDQGATAEEKVEELIGHLLIAVATIVVLVGAALGWRAALIVALAVPLTLAGALFLGLLAGLTINRVTLFALILSLGLLVDDPIVDVENIHRHLAAGREPPRRATLRAVEEVRPPVILATLAVVASFLPMFFVGGMMGPYMRPMPFHVPVAMLLSMLIAFTVTPWASLRLLCGAGAGGAHDADAPGPLARGYRRLAAWFLARRRRGVGLLAGVAVALAGALGLAASGGVPLKMLPFDNRSELQVVVDAPEGWGVERTARAVRDLARTFLELPETADVTAYSGHASPHDFNGMVRHDFLRRGGHVGDLRVQFAPRHERGRQTHAIALAARPALEQVAARHGVRIAIVETPPGPPVLAGVVAELRPPLAASAEELDAAALRLADRFRAVPYLRDVDTFVAAARPKLTWEVDREAAAQRGVAPERVAATLAAALSGLEVGALRDPRARAPVPIRLELPRAARSTEEDLLALAVHGAGGAAVPLSALLRRAEAPEEPVLYRKDLRPVQYVVGEAVGRSPVDAVFALKAGLDEEPLPAGWEVDLAGEGEWQITVEVFRDLGLAFAAALAAIYVLLVAQTRSFALSGLIMLSIPLTMIGIFPGFWALDRLAAGRVGEFADPIFFTATGMIGMIALAGIVVRNSIILVDFIEEYRARGMPTAQACVEAAAVRLRPIALTAGAAVMGAWVIVFDPIFSGLAWSFVFGILASTAFTLLVVPVAYALLRGAESPRADQPPGTQSSVSTVGAP